MARVFLSYDREDSGKTRLIAQALERAGHFVWWDLHIKGGAEYGKVIEQALAEADAVIVLWSPRSVDSAWVRDEAAAGRDSGRLIPVLLEPVNPPMGFRQYQCIDLSKWKGRGKPPQLSEVLASIEGLAGVAQPTSAASASVVHTRAKSFPRWVPVAAVLLLVLVGAALLISKIAGNGAQTVAVAPAGSSTAAQSLARDLLAKLGNLQSTRTDSLMLVQGHDAERKSDFIFNVDAANHGENATASLVLLRGKDRSLLWSRDFEQPAARQGDLRQQVAFTAAKVLECAVEALASEGTRIRQETLKLYLNGCSAFSELAAADPRPLLPIFREVVKQAPKFEGAWGKLIHTEAEIVASIDWEREAPKTRAALLRHMAQARKLNPDMAAVLLTEAGLAPPGDYGRRMRMFERAVERNPDSSEALSAYSQYLMKVGRAFDSIDQAKKAAQLDPLSPLTRDTVITALTYAGRTDEAIEELQKAEKLWPGASNLLAARYRLHLRYGDPHEALRIQRMGDYGGPHRDAFLKARLDPSPENIETAISYPRRWFQITPRAISELAQVLGAFRKEEELFRILLNWRYPKEIDYVDDVLFRPALRNFHRDPRMIAVAKRLGLLDYWQESGDWPDFCMAPDLPYDCKAEAAKLA
jgi:tetratricopeptide (TPR) repeat protein